ncbi:MAG: type II toxin-antitoxin system VapC family toxin [Acidobacteriota bacterium]|nr:type II toxin-antitoxin system VapC family toxin [Acidobacteriota bacterium]MDH3529264.1 type II toxin-antitoxin system VapC family toxin [Acidobacteriota bacterium]
MKPVLDAGVAVKFYLPEYYESEASRRPGGNHQFHAPELIFPGFSSVIWKNVRNGELIFEEGLEIIKAFLDFAMVTHSCHQTALSAFAGAESTGFDGL